MSDLKKYRDECKAFAIAHLKECCAELSEWQDTAVLRDGRVRQLANLCSKFISNHDGLRVAESFINRAAIDAQLAQPVTGSIEELIGDYWAIAYSEGRTGVSRGDDANEVLHRLRQAIEAQRAPADEAPTEQLSEALANFLAEHTRLNQDGIDGHAMRMSMALNYAALNPVPEAEIAEWHEQGYLADEAQGAVDDPVELWARIHRLEADMKGPKGFATWKDAAVYERKLRVVKSCEAEEVFMLKRQIHNLKRHIEDYCPESMPVSGNAGEGVARHELSEAEKSALAEAAKTGATIAEMDGGGIMFINRGEQPGDYDFPTCPTCHGSGHADDVAEHAKRAEPDTPARPDGGILGHRLPRGP